MPPRAGGRESSSNCGPSPPLAAVIHAATLATLDRLGVADRLVAQGIKVPNFRIRDRDRVLIHADFSKLRAATPYALMIPQDETEAILIERLESLGHSVRRPALVTGIETAGEEGLVHCEAEGRRETIRCRYIVGADGSKSVVRSGAGIGFPGSTYGSFLLADVRMRWPLPRDEVSLFFSGEGVLVVAPMSNDRYRVVAQAAEAPSVPSVADIQRVVDARGPSSGAEVREALWGSRFQVHHMLADRFLEGPVVLLGDAAHVHSPAGGQGMNLGLRDGAMLAGSLADALARGSRAPLELYCGDAEIGGRARPSNDPPADQRRHCEERPRQPAAQLDHRLRGPPAPAPAQIRPDPGRGSVTTAQAAH